MSAAFACLTTSEQNDWATGLCMLYCRRDGVRVLGLGPVQVAGAEGQLYGCGQCVAELDYMVYRQSGRTRCPKPGAAADSSAGRWWRWQR